MREKRSWLTQAIISPSTNSAAVELVPHWIESSFMSSDGRKLVRSRFQILTEHNSSDLAERIHQGAELGASHLYVHG